MEGLVEGLRRFREEAFPGYEDLFHKLAHAKAVPLRLDVGESVDFIAFRDEVIAVLDSEWKASSPSWTTASSKASA